MANARITIPALFGGVSTQPPALRHPNQVEAADNVYFSVRDDASKRPGAEHLFVVTGLSTSVDYRLHAIDRDELEKYLMIYGDSTVKVYDTAGVAQTVTISTAAQAYLNEGNATCDDMRVVTIADYTLLANTTVEVDTKASPTYHITGTLPDADAVHSQLPAFDQYFYSESDTPTWPKGYWHYIVPTADNGFALWTGEPLGTDWDLTGTYFWDDDAKNPMGFTVLFTHAPGVANAEWFPAAYTIYKAAAFASYTWQSGDVAFFSGVGAETAIAAKLNNNAIRLSASIGANIPTPTLVAFGTDITSLDSAYDTATGVLSKTGLFANYTFQAGDKVYLMALLAGLVGWYDVTSKIDNDSIQLATGLGSSPSTVFTSTIKRVAISVAVEWFPAPCTLYKADGFATYTQVPGDALNVTAGTGATTGNYDIIDRISDNAITLATSLGVYNADTDTDGIGSTYEVTEDFYATPARDGYAIAKRLQDKLQAVGAQDALIQFVESTTMADSYFKIISPFRGENATTITLSAPANTDDNYDLTTSPRPFHGGTVTPGSGTPATDTLPIYSPDTDVDSRWERVPPPGQRNAMLDETTMPIKITRTVYVPPPDPSTFAADVIDWKPRLSGNEDTNAPPALWDKNQCVADISFHRNRLVLCGGENVEMSQAGDFFNFWLDDADNIGDSDPVEAPCSSNRVTVIDFVVPFRKSLVIFTKAGQQFELNAPEVLTPATAAMTASTMYNTISNVRPATVGTQVYFAAQDDSGSQIREYVYNDSNTSERAADITAHAQGYLPTDLTTLCSCPNMDVIYALARDDNALYRYRSYVNGEEKLQSAWSRVLLDASYTLVDAAAIGNDLYLLVKVGSQFHVLRLPADQVATPTGMPYMPRLDNWKLVTGTNAAGFTTWTYTFVDDSIDCVVLGPALAAPGTVLTATQVTGNASVKVADATGIYAGQPCYVGTNFNMDMTLSRPYQRDQNGAAVLDAQLILHYITLTHNATGGYFVTVATPGFPTTTEMYVPDAGTTIDAVGETSFFVRGRAQDTTVTIESLSPKPCTIVTGEWTATFQSRAN